MSIKQSRRLKEPHRSWIKLVIRGLFNGTCEVLLTITMVNKRDIGRAAAYVS